MSASSTTRGRPFRVAFAGALALAVSCATAGGARAGAADDCNSDAPDKMIAGCTEVLKTVSDPAAKVAAFARRGFAHKQRTECEPAIADFSEALRVTANNVAILVLRGECYAAINHPNEALADFGAVIKIDPQNREAAAAIDRLRPKAAAGTEPAANAGSKPTAGESEMPAGAPVPHGPTTIADLNGLWTTDDGRVIQIAQNGNRVTWHSCCRQGHEFSVVSVSATLEGHTVVGTYQYREGASSGVGTIHFTLNGDRLEGVFTPPNGQTENAVLTRRLGAAGASAR